MAMERTIQMMKENNLFESIVQNVLHKDMPKDATECAIIFTMSIDEEFEDTFLQEAHDIAVDVIWSAVQEAVKEQSLMDQGAEFLKKSKDDVQETKDKIEALSKQISASISMFLNSIIDDGK